MSNLPTDIEILNPGPEHFNGIQDLCRRVYPFSKPWSVAQLESHQAHFPDGQLIAVEKASGKLLGLAFSLIVSWDDYSLQDSWEDFTSGGFFHNHNPKRGRTLYGAEVMVDPEARGRGIGKLLYTARREIAKKYKLKRIRAGARLRGYGKYANKMSPEEYTREVVQNRIFDPTLSFQLGQGFVVLDVSRNYLYNDPESLGYAAVIEWLNPETATNKDFKNQSENVTAFLEGMHFVPHLLPRELRHLVRKILFMLGEVIKDYEGELFFNKIEAYRRSLKKLRIKASQQQIEILLKKLSAEKSEDQLKIARAFTLLLDLINICETSYRTWRLQQKPTLKPLAKKALLNLVLRTYSVEIRSPLFIDLLRQLSDLLIWGLQSNFDLDHMAIRSKLRFLWQVPLAPGRKLSLRNEAEYNYSLILKQPILDFLLREYPSYQLKLSSWTGGDRRNWPQLDETGMLDCFRMSRGILLADIREKLGELASDLKKMGRSTDLIGLIKQDCQKLEVLTKGDGARVLAFKARFEKLLEDADVYLREHENVYLIKRLFVLFPALVVPISLRERPKLMREALNNSRHTFSRILKMLKAISLGCDPSGFVKSLVISPCESVGDLNTAKELIQKYWDASLLPLSPSFEDRESLSHSKKILSQWLDQGGMEDLVRGAWSNKMEIYLAYSDSSINIGSLPSRRLLQKSMYSLESTMKSRKIESIFFHGEGGELLRGGGALRDQISWWTSGAIRRPKISLQGEMISRVFSTEEVLNSWALHLSKELQLSQARRDKSIKSTVFDQFCQLAEESFKQRPRIEMKSGRSLDLLMREDFCNGNDILLSTQTRNLIIAWWGLGSAWASLKSDQKTEIQRIFQENSFFSSFVKRLAFALSKVEPEIWKLYLNSQFPKEGEQHFKQFVDEFKKSKKFVFEVSGEKSLLWFRPWLEESIRLRSAYIHPLNLLQLIALEHKKEDLLRTTLIGISSGMMTTG